MPSLADVTLKIGLSDSDKTTMAEGVLDEIVNGEVEIDGETTNFSELKDAIDDAIDSIENKANVDGNYPTMTVGYSDNITPYSDESGSEQSKPFVAQGTATDNGTAEVTVGSFAQLREKQGNTLAWNQGFDNSNVPSQGGSFEYYRTGGVIRLVGTVTDDTYSLFSSTVSLKNGHKYLLLVDYHGNAPSNSTWQFYDTATQVGYLLNTRVFTASEDVSDTFQIAAYAGAVLDVSIRVALIDLTQLFPVDTPTSVTDPRVLWAIQYATLHPAYNAGSLINGDGVKLACSGRNLWDEETEVIGGRLWSKNYIPVIPKGDYYYYVSNSDYYLTIYEYDKDFNEITNYNFVNNSKAVSSNCCYIKFAERDTYGTTYNHDITISLYYASGQDYDEYFPYEEPKVYDTGNEVLRSAGNAHDVKLPDGTITRNVGVVDLGTLNWDVSGAGNMFAILADKKAIDYSEPLGICAKYVNDLTNNPPDKTMWAGGNQIYIKDSAYSDPAQFKAAMSGVYLFYELATPTTEQGTPFPENISVNDYGMMTWLKADGTYAEIPQGSLFFYPADYKGMLDDIYYRCTPSGNASDLVVQSELSASETARDAVDAQLKAALGGTLRQLLAATKSIDFDDTAWVDLGTLAWQDNDNGGFNTNGFAGADWGSSTSDAPNATCSKYKSVSLGDLTNGTLGISVLGSGELWVKDPSFLNASAFKQAMKGVLLAYEKASS